MPCGKVCPGVPARDHPLHTVPKVALNEWQARAVVVPRMVAHALAHALANSGTHTCADAKTLPAGKLSRVCPIVLPGMPAGQVHQR